MKNLFVPLFLLLALHSSTAQESYRSVFGEQQTSWNITGYGLTLEGEYHYTDSFSVSGDTLLNGFVSKLLKQYTNGTFNGQWADAGFIYLVSEDTVSGRVWVSYPLWGSPHLVQDMSLSETDSFYLSGVFTWAHVDTIYFDNDGRKVIELDYVTGMGLPFTMIEGIGPNVGILHPHDMMPLYDSECPVLLCHHKDGETVYVNNHPLHSGQCQRLVTGLQNLPESEDTGLSLFPNPCALGHALKVTTSRPMTEVRVTDALGRTVKTFLLESETELSFSLGRAGFYFLHVDNQRPRKFIIRDH